MKLHLSIHIAGVVDVEVVSPTDIKANLIACHDHASGYIDGEGGTLSPAMFGAVQLTGGELMADWLKNKVVTALRESTEDITLQMQNKGGDA